MFPSLPRRLRRSRSAVIGAVVTAMAVAACAPTPGGRDETAVDEVAVGAEDASTGQAAASEAARRAASEAAASEAAASEAAASEAAREAAEVEAARKAAEEAAARKAAEEAAAKKAAEEAAAKKAAEEAAAKKAAEEAAAKKAAEEAAAEEARKKAEREAREAREVQTTLADLGYYEGGIDGDVGPLTLAAIEDFQAVNGLEVDGVVGPNTEAALASDDALPKPPPPPPPPPPDSDDDEDEDGDGDEDEDEDGDSGLPDGVLSVEVAQQELVDRGYYLGPVDGKKSDSLAYALQAFQLVNGITADGILGPGTSAALRDPVTPKLVGGPSTRIEIDLDHQVMHLVKGGNRVRTMPTSSGNGEQYLQADGDTANAKTPVGTFTIQRRISGERVADLGTLYDPMYFYKGWAIHGSNSVPPYPASHGCTRLPRADALWLWDQVPNGTTVVIHGGEHTFIPTG